VSIDTLSSLTPLYHAIESGSSANMGWRRSKGIPYARGCCLNSAIFELLIILRMAILIGSSMFLYDGNRSDSEALLRHYPLRFGGHRESDSSQAFICCQSIAMDCGNIR
jgi:hypothetical protein